MSDMPEFAAACLSAFGGVAKAWYAARYPTRGDILDQLEQASRIFPPGKHEDDLGIMIAGTIVSATDISATPWTVARCISTIRTIGGGADGHVSGGTFEMALSDDIRDLDGASAPAIAAIPLWPGGHRRPG